VFITEPPKTQGDLNFSLWGIPVRISVWFWVAAVVLGWHFTMSRNGARDLLIWTAAVLLSILVHELGHSLAHRMYGMGSRIVLYHLGGLAIPDSLSTFRGNHPKQQIVISGAGPAMQMGSAFLLMSVIALAGKAIPLGGFMADLLGLRDFGVPSIENEAFRLFSVFYLNVSIYWALLNLLPIYPLDGGKIARELFLLSGHREAMKNSLILSIAVATGAALYGLTSGTTFMTLMFGIMAAENYMALRAYTGGGFGRGYY
jgi:Zn-dependent protease